jgi:hypothetical protein
MDSTAVEEDVRDAKRAMLTPSSGDGIDLISRLDDDVLLRVLGLVPDASIAARASTLSRRWLGLWMRVPALRFASRLASWAARGAERRAAMDEFVSLVNGVLAQRTHQSGCCAVETLSISYTSDCAQSEEELVQAVAFGAVVRGWIGYAFEHGVKTFLLDLPRDMFELDVVLDELLPIPVRLETMRLALGYRCLWLPTTIAFASLTDLSLEGIKIIEASSANQLSRLVSSTSCPRLQKLRMRGIYFYIGSEDMRLEADVLSELWMEDVHASRLLKLLTRSLRVLHIYKCSHEMLSISAPRLEELALSFQREYPPKSLEIHGDMPCVRSLKICFRPHRASRHREAEMNANALLLEHCRSSLTCLDVTLQLQGEVVSLAGPYLSKLK